RPAGAHRLSAAFDNKPPAHRPSHRAADAEAGDGTPRAGAAAGLERDGKSGPAELLLQARGNKPDDARMPTFSGSYDNRAFAFDAQRSIRFGLGLGQCFLFDRLPLAVEPIEFSGNPCRLDRIILEQEPHAQIGSADAATGHE